MKKILVTGGTSYIGKHCIAHLLKKKYDVRASIRNIKNAESVRTDLQKYLKKDIKRKRKMGHLTTLIK